MSFTYDGNLLLSETWAGTVSGSVSRTYDNDFWVASQSVNASNTVNLSYDADGLLTGSGALSVTRDAQTGLVTGTALGSVSDSSNYSNFGELTGYNASANSSPVFDVQYTRDALGRISEKAETVAGVSHTYAYNYDLAGRLTDVMTDGTTTAQYAYDANSNRIGGYTATGTISATYDAQDRLLAYGAATYAYTANGELQSRTDASGTATYTYDVLGNLAGVTLVDGAQIQYVVDGKKRRIGKKVNGTLIQSFLYDGQLRIVAELDGSNQVVSRFVYGGKPNVPEYVVKGGATYRLISDHLGSVRLVMDTTDGSIAQGMDYDEFGNVVFDQVAAGFQRVPFGFGGGLYDRDTKLVRFGARDYDAQTGRWVAKDPIRFAGSDTNLYGYVLGDPISGLDVAGEGPILGLTVGGLCLAYEAWGKMSDLNVAARLATATESYRLRIQELEGKLAALAKQQSCGDSDLADRIDQVNAILQEMARLRRDSLSVMWGILAETNPAFDFFKGVGESMVCSGLAGLAFAAPVP